MSDALLPCPFCGGEARVNENDWCEPPLFYVACYGEGCFAHAHSNTDRANAISRWNRRIPDVGRDALVTLRAIDASLKKYGHSAYEWINAVETVAAFDLMRDIVEKNDE